MVTDIFPTQPECDLATYAELGVGVGAGVGVPAPRTVANTLPFGLPNPVQGSQPAPAEYLPSVPVESFVPCVMSRNALLAELA
jgi:hypothetical protein